MSYAGVLYVNTCDKLFQSWVLPKTCFFQQSLFQRNTPSLSAQTQTQLRGRRPNIGLSLLSGMLQHMAHLVWSWSGSGFVFSCGHGVHCFWLHAPWIIADSSDKEVSHQLELGTTLKQKLHVYLVEV